MPAVPQNSSGMLGFPHRDRSRDYQPDYTRTTRPHAGEAIEDSRNWPGLLLSAAGIVAIALTLTAAGYGFEGWAVLGAFASTALLGLGISLMVAEHRRVAAERERADGTERGRASEADRR
ncbi:hypothetical protein [Nocardia sp. NPDC127526]|uniref:hypothetical protein n=1 Tax=Nocardia sp. NPDC127526 TaxID=3345393 RepID=UPI00362DD8BE